MRLCDLRRTAGVVTEKLKVVGREVVATGIGRPAQAFPCRAIPVRTQWLLRRATVGTSGLAGAPGSTGITPRTHRWAHAARRPLELPVADARSMTKQLLAKRGIGS